METRTLEALLFTSAKPLKLTQLAKTFEVKVDQIEDALTVIETKYSGDASGIQLMRHDGAVQFVTHPDEGEMIKRFYKQEVGGELTRPSLETLTIIAYRGPITKPEIEQIRGVNCTLILRNLLIRGLIAERDDKERLQPVYTVTSEFVRHLGINSLSELPEYATLHADEMIDHALEDIEQKMHEENV
jgi:segregation and condensation protein B